MRIKKITAVLAAVAMICSISTVSVATSSNLPFDDSVESNADSTSTFVGESVESDDGGKVSDAAAEDGKPYPWPLLEGVGTIVEGGEIQVNGETNKLYLCFADPEEALEGIKAKVPSILSLLAGEFHLAALSDSNWQDYYDAMFMMFESENIPEDYNESNIEFRTLRQFFDFYENTEKNEEILGCAESLYSRQAGDTEEIVTELAFLLPYTEPVVQEYMNNRSVQARALTYDAAKAVEYATKYATSPNTPTYYFFHNGDCANFVSQILENSGVQQIVYDDAAKGWWHTRTGGFLGIYTHKHSQSWSMADTFSRYQGFIFTTSTFREFLINLYNRQTHFISADTTGDGDFNHCGFVTQVTSSDCKIAQHTSNYHEWTYGSSVNNWENIGSDGGRYARLRE